MPHFILCPWCKTLIVDWFHEWYPKPQYDQIKLGHSAMDCPHHQCRQSVTLNKGILVPAQNLVTEQRSLLLALMKAIPAKPVVDELRRTVTAQFLVRKSPDTALSNPSLAPYIR
jgi:hypothetical protein